MKGSPKTAQTIFSELSNKISGNKIKLSVARYPTPAKNDRLQYVNIVVKSLDRSDTLEIVRNSLTELKLKFKESVYPGSSFYGLQITDYAKIGNVEKGIRILFKFPDGSDKKNYNIWNGLLEHVFKSNTSLKRQPSNRIEVGVLKTINQKIEKLGHGKPVTLRIRNKRYLNVVGFVGGVGVKKADFVIINSDGNEIGYLSYKAGSSATSFQQYSGITERAGDKIANHPEVLEFNEIVLNNWETLSPSVSREIESNNLKKQAVFGKDYLKKSGYDSVDFLVQGQPRLIERSGIVYLSFTSKMVKKGDLTKLMGNYEPVLGARKGEFYRRIKVKNKSIQGVRGGIWTKAYMSSRKNKEI
jgi:hypothetical protein